MERARVLVADSEAIIRMDLKKVLEQLGFNVEATFRTGEELLSFAQADDPQLLIMDTFLTGKLDGYTTAREVLKTNKIPVIFMTSEPHSRYDKSVNIGGHYEYLHKPFSESELKDVLRKFYPDL